MIVSKPRDVTLGGLYGKYVKKSRFSWNKYDESSFRACFSTSHHQEEELDCLTTYRSLVLVACRTFSLTSLLKSIPSLQSAGRVFASCQQRQKKTQNFSCFLMFN